MYKMQKIKAILKGIHRDHSFPPSPSVPVTIYPYFPWFELQPALVGSTCSLSGNVGKERKDEKGLMNTTLLSSSGQEAEPLIQAPFHPGDRAVTLPALKGRASGRSGGKSPG